MRIVIPTADVRERQSADMHACMIQGLQVQEGDHVLDIGSGCGVTTAILAYLVRSLPDVD